MTKAKRQLLDEMMQKKPTINQMQTFIDGNGKKNLRELLKPDGSKCSIPFMAKIVGSKPEDGYVVHILISEYDMTKCQAEGFLAQLVARYEPPSGSVLVAMAPPRGPPSGDMQCFDEFICELMMTGDIDANRVHVRGYAAGADWARHFATQKPYRFASLVMLAPFTYGSCLNLCGVRVHVAKDRSNFNPTAIRAFTAYKDSLTKLREKIPDWVEAFIEERDYGVPWKHEKDDPSFTLVQDIVRDPMPARMVLEGKADSALPFHSGWAAVMKVTPDEDWIAVVTRTSENVLKINASGVETIRIYFGLGAVDGKKEVEIFFNGESRFKEKLVGQYDVFTETLLRFCDGNFLAYCAVDIPKVGDGSFAVVMTPPPIPDELNSL